MLTIIRGFIIALSCAALFFVTSEGVHAATLTLPHSHDFSALAPWSKVSNGASIVNAPSAAPGSSASSLRFAYPKGFVNGDSPDKVWATFSPSATELWTQYYFMYSSNYYFHTVDNKQMYWYVDDSTLSSNWYITCAGTMKMNMVYQRSPGSGRYEGNTSYNPTITSGVWYKVTTRAVLNTGSQSNGIFQLWIYDESTKTDRLVIDVKNVPYLTGTDVNKKVGSLAFDPIFGGSAGLSKPAEDYFYIDNVKISVDGNGYLSTGDGSGGNTSPPLVPMAPSNIGIQ